MTPNAFTSYRRTMKKKQILFIHYGENFGTAKSPFAKVLSVDGHIATIERKGVSEKVDLRTEKTVCLGFDDDRLTGTELYRVREIELPEWMTVEFYIEYEVALKYFVGLGGSLEWAEQWVTKLLTFPETRKFVCFKLLNTKNFKSEFRKSLRDQLEKWLNGGSEFSSPFSDRQWASLTDNYSVREANRISRNLYNSC